MIVRFDETDSLEVKQLSHYDWIKSFIGGLEDAGSRKMRVTHPSNLACEKEFSFRTSEKDIWNVFGLMSEELKWAIGAMTEAALAQQEEFIYQRKGGQKWVVTRIANTPPRVIGLHFSSTGR